MKKQPATAVLGAALNAFGYHLLHDYMRTHRGPEFRRYARRHAAAALPSGKRYVLQQLLNDWGWMAQHAQQRAAFVQKNLSDDWDLHARHAAIIAPLVDPDYQATLPATVHGCGSREAGYWFEPASAVNYDHPTFTFTVSEQADMEPRFLPEQHIRVQRIHAKQDLLPGRVYVRECAGYVQLLRVTRVRGQLVETVRDLTGRAFTFALRNNFNRARRGYHSEVKWYRFVNYAGGAQLLTLANVYQKRVADEMEAAAQTLQQAPARPVVGFVPKHYGRAARRQAQQAA